MPTEAIVLQSKSGPDCKLHLEVEVGQPNAEFEVEVLVRSKSAQRSFPPGYFDLIGSIDDETLTVHSQPPMPPSEPLEVE